MDDMAFRIAEAVASQIELIPFSPAPETVAVRDTDVLHPTDTLPAIILTATDDEETGWAVSGNGIDNFGDVGRAYLVFISIYRTFTGESQTDLDSNTKIGKLIREALNKPFLDGVDEVWDTQVSPCVTVNPSGLAKGVKKSSMSIRFHTCEGRNGQ